MGTWRRVQEASAVTPLAVRVEHLQRSRQVREGWREASTRHTWRRGRRVRS